MRRKHREKLLIQLLIKQNLVRTFNIDQFPIVGRDSFSRKSQIKNSWSGPFAKKTNRKIINIESGARRERFDSKEKLGSTTAPQGKRFHATQLFEKKRFDRIQNIEKETPAVIAPNMKTFKAAVIDPSQMIQNFKEKEYIRVSGIYEKSRTGFIPIGPETGFQAKSNQDAYMTIRSF